MLRLSLFPLLAAAVIAAVASLGPTPTHSQQPQTADLLWDLAPVGLLADQRLRDGIDQLVDSQAVLRTVGVSGTLRYAGAPGATQGRRDQVRLLFAAAGFDQPGAQIAQQRRCRIWLGNAILMGSALKEVLPRAIADGLATLGVRVDTCELASSPQEADILLWNAGEPAPLPEHDSRPQEQSFLIALPRQNTPGMSAVPRPPTTGDGGLVVR
jgi:hypothetical protein